MKRLIQWFGGLNKVQLTIEISTFIFLSLYIAHFHIWYTPDSGAYLMNARSGEVPIDRTIYYSWFLSFFQHLSNGVISIKNHLLNPRFNIDFNSIGANLLVSILIPILILYWGLKKLYRDIANGPSHIFGFLICLIFINVFTALPWFMWQVMPDIFTPITFLFAWHWLNRKNAAEAWIYGLITVLSATMHNANLLSLTLFSSGWLGMKWLQVKIDFFKPATAQIENSTPFKNCIQLITLSLIPWAMVIFSNLIGGNGLTISKGSHVFIMGKLCENGILKTYLDDECEETQSTNQNFRETLDTFCKYKNELPQHTWDFVWNSNGLLDKTGGWHHSEPAYSAIIKNTLTKPKYLGLHLVAAAKATSEQFILTHGGDGLSPIDTASTLAKELQIQYPNDYQSLLRSPQQTSSVDFAPYNQIYDFSTLIIILLGLLLLQKNPDINHIKILGATTLFVLFNAFVTASFANVLSRLNARDFWLIPFVMSAIIVHTIWNAYKLKNQSTINL